VSLAAAVLRGVVLAQPPGPAGSEFQVNAYTTSHQSASASAMASDGDFVVVWSGGYDQDGSGNGVLARRFNAAGIPQAAEFQVNLYTTSSQGMPVVGIDGDGDFVVAWSSEQDGSMQGVFARRFDAAGIAQGAEFQVNVHTLGRQNRPDVGSGTDGGFVVVWQSSDQDGSEYGVFARRFDPAGIAQAGEFQINTYTTDSQSLPAIDIAADGDFVVAWQSDLQDGSTTGVFARRFNSAGMAQGGESQVNQYTPSGQSTAAVGIDGDGDFVIVWTSFTQDGFYHGVFGRRFNGAGVAQGGEFQVNVYTTHTQSHPSIGVAGDGDFVVAWRSEGGQDGSLTGVFGRHFDSAGIAQGAEFQVNVYTTDIQFGPTVGMKGDGDFVVAWDSKGQDGDGYGVFARRYQTPSILDIDGNGSVAPLTDGLLVLRYLFGFTGATLVTGAFDVVGCTRCNAPTIEAYLGTLI
jgi:phosphoheptose isomerase